MRYISAAIAIIVLIAIVIFSIQNLAVTEVSFLTLSLTIPKFLIFIGIYVLGMFTGAWLFDLLKQLWKTNKKD
ncbi:DUF1049 domain-containing protein [Calycomorphotria hydatis]|uniref:Lipopolysaccharide assembly protein A domain-containing protein n=1 Tax=Calycomorphotria hydatis TaxID=2528027 RepID=A0A517TC89_9PLAN|nr:DUF1049 domain-containing protein [Calycomorphotria hydatis]QDT65982.1 hypothetical protein V22_32460 [Calycomorphotria hydatis]